MGGRYDQIKKAQLTSGSTSWQVAIMRHRKKLGSNQKAFLKHVSNFSWVYFRCSCYKQLRPDSKRPKLDGNLLGEKIMKSQQVLHFVAISAKLWSNFHQKWQSWSNFGFLATEREAATWIEFIVASCNFALLMRLNRFSLCWIKS